MAQKSKQYKKAHMLQMLERVWREGKTLALLVGVWIDAVTVESSVEVP